MPPVEPVPAEHLKRFMRYVLFEERGVMNGRCVFVREDKPRPIQFQEQGLVPIVQILSIIRYLGITVEKYHSIMEVISKQN